MQCSSSSAKRIVMRGSAFIADSPELFDSDDDAFASNLRKRTSRLDDKSLSNVLFSDKKQREKCRSESAVSKKSLDFSSVVS